MCSGTGVVCVSGDEGRQMRDRTGRSGVGSGMWGEVA